MKVADRSEAVSFWLASYSQEMIAKIVAVRSAERRGRARYDRRSDRRLWNSHPRKDAAAV